MAGYHNYSMSNNAVAAYDEGKMPKSKWTKSAILDAIDEDEDKECTVEMASKLTLDELRGMFLEWTEWHHTSSKFNQTDFYAVRCGRITDEDIQARIENREPKEKKVKAEKPQAIKAKVRYGEWEGTRKHPKLKEYTAYAVVVGNWAYLEGGYKKKTGGKYFTIIEQYDRAPKGTADTFKKIAQFVK